MPIREISEHWYPIYRKNILNFMLKNTLYFTIKAISKANVKLEGYYTIKAICKTNVKLEGKSKPNVLD